jgi:hypothetical protein
LVAVLWAWYGSIGATTAEGSGEAEVVELVTGWMELGVSMSDELDTLWQVYCRLLAAFGYTSLGSTSAAVAHLEDAVERGTALDGYESLVGTACGYLAMFRVLAGDFDDARVLSERVLERSNQVVPFREGPLTSAIASAAAGDGVLARHQLEIVYDDIVRCDLPLGVDQVVLFGGVVAALSDDWETAARLLAAGHEGLYRSPAAYLLYRTFRDRCRAELGPDRARRYRDEGRQMSRDEAVAVALGR